MYSEFEAVKFTSQVVAGTNYVVKYKVGADQYIHAMIFEPLPNTNMSAEVTKVKMDGITATTPLETF